MRAFGADVLHRVAAVRGSDFAKRRTPDERIELRRDERDLHACRLVASAGVWAVLSARTQRPGVEPTRQRRSPQPNLVDRSGHPTVEGSQQNSRAAELWSALERVSARAGRNP
jgi:hypothetical protein